MLNHTATRIDVDILLDPLVLELLSGKKQTYSQEVTHVSREVGKSEVQTGIFPNLVNELSTSLKPPFNFPKLPQRGVKPSQQYRERALKQLELRRGSQYSQHPLASPVSDSVYLVYLRMIESVCQEMDRGASGVGDFSDI